VSGKVTPIRGGATLKDLTVEQLQRLLERLQDNGAAWVLEGVNTSVIFETPSASIRVDCFGGGSEASFPPHASHTENEEG
jgi:hypothetical protein